MERRIKSLVRWNALAMVVRANKIQEGIGGHLNFCLSRNSLRSGLHHFLRAKTETGDRDVVYFQGSRSRNLCPRIFEGRNSQREVTKTSAAS